MQDDNNVNYHNVTHNTGETQEAHPTQTPSTQGGSQVLRWMFILSRFSSLIFLGLFAFFIFAFAFSVDGFPHPDGDLWFGADAMISAYWMIGFGIALLVSILVGGIRRNLVPLLIASIGFVMFLLEEKITTDTFYSRLWSDYGFSGLSFEEGIMILAPLIGYCLILFLMRKSRKIWGKSTLPFYLLCGYIVISLIGSLYYIFSIHGTLTDDAQEWSYVTDVAETTLETIIKADEGELRLSEQEMDELAEEYYQYKHAGYTIQDNAKHHAHRFFWLGIFVYSIFGFLILLIDTIKRYRNRKEEEYSFIWSGGILHRMLIQ